MSHDSTTPGSDRDRTVDRLIAATAALGLISTVTVAYIELASGHGQISWTLFTVLAVLLFATETRPTTWMRFGKGGAVTASWTFTFALMLLGTPLGAIAVMSATTIVADLLERKAFRKVVFNVSQLALSLSIGALILFAFGIHGPVFTDGHISTTRSLAMILSGIVVFTTNGVVLCRLLAIIEETTFWEMMRDSFALSMSADAAMLAMAPILVITAEQNLLMLPLIGSATFFVYQTARQAIQRAHEANHDPLTQLMNRRAFSGELDEFVESPTASTSFGSVFLLDLDRFKEVNDRLGHRTGDHVLQAFAQRLVESLPDDVVIARLGGDEFAVLLEGFTPTTSLEVAERLHDLLDEPLTVDGFPISAGTSIGVSHYPHHGATPSELLHAADVAMYRAKRFRSGVETYEVLSSVQQKGRVALLADLADGISNGEFSLSYQPQIDLRTNELVSVEALLRWDHPRHGAILPNEFVGLAEQTDLIGPLSNFVIHQALADIASLDSTIRVAVNISARNLRDRHFARSVLDHLAATGFAPRRLEFEITESALALEPEYTSAALTELRQAGITVSVDDFGTGYSSFSTLRDLSVDRVKIDRSFITNAASNRSDRHIVRSVVDLAHNLGLEVIAEGVECLAVRSLLAEMKCDLVQGFLIAHPMPIDDLRALLEQIDRQELRADLMADGA